ncbi:MAG: SMC-Scp complex subunit ScpB [Candidatus Eisenbacteria bacterium]
METRDWKPVLEALLFAADQPLPATLLAEACEIDLATVSETLLALAADYEQGGRGVRLSEIAGGWQYLTREDFAPYLGRMLRGKKKMRLSRPALETLAIIAYKQPVTKAEVDAIRGVDSSGVLNTLLERELVTIRGRSKVVGRPLLYGTTGEFLSYFGLNDLNELPRVEELKAIVGEREPENPEAEPELFLPVPEAVAGVVAEMMMGETPGQPDPVPAGAPDDPLDFALADEAIDESDDDSEEFDASEAGTADEATGDEGELRADDSA